MFLISQVILFEGQLEILLFNSELQENLVSQQDIVVFLLLLTTSEPGLANLKLKVCHELKYLDCFFDSQIVARNYCKGVILVLPMFLSSKSDSHLYYLSIELEEGIIVLFAILEPNLPTLQILVSGKIEIVQD